MYCSLEEFALSMSTKYNKDKKDVLEDAHYLLSKGYSLDSMVDCLEYEYRIERGGIMATVIYGVKDGILCGNIDGTITNKLDILRTKCGWVGSDSEIAKDLIETINDHKRLTTELELLTNNGVLERLLIH